MSNSRFQSCLNFTLQWEGGFVDHPKDPGGATNKGVTLKTFRSHFGRDSTIEDLKNITDDQLRAIYETGYWGPSQASLCPEPLDLTIFDAAVHSGPKRAIKFLQTALGCDPDGIFGPKTSAALGRVRAEEGGFEPVTIAFNVISARLAFLKGLKTWETFGRGWQRRLVDLHEEVTIAMYRATDK